MLKQSLKSPIIYTLIIGLLFCIPGFQVLQLTLKEQHTNNSLELMQWSALAKEAVATSKDKEALHVKLPSSVVYTFGLYDSARNILYSTLTQEPSTFAFSARGENGYFYYQTVLDSNPLNALYLVVAMPVSNTKIILMGTVILLLTLCVVYVTAHFMIMHSIKPYQQTQDYMNTFFNDAMHELKTPLGVIHINLELLEATQSESKYIGRMKAATKQMQMTYEDVEYYIKHTRSSFNSEIVDLSHYLGERVRFFEDIARAKQILLKPTIAPKLIVFMNKIELQRIIDNTISNAIKYSNPASSVIVELVEKDGQASFRVEDFGKGIKDTKRIFERFEREDLIQGGFGLGLNIVKNICQKYGISYHVSSVLARGSTFVYLIPLYEERWLDKLEDA
ncbi:sensor histidine kinase [Sulfurospirillum tamanense]|nr:HAMP domain-containing sensor histidine kinase [Sulfurospirillum tamanensis]